MITVCCPHCNVEMEVEEEYAGKPGRCSQCREVFVVPGGEPEPHPPESESDEKSGLSFLSPADIESSEDLFRGAAVGGAAVGGGADEPAEEFVAEEADPFGIQEAVEEPAEAEEVAEAPAAAEAPAEAPAQAGAKVDQPEENLAPAEAAEKASPAEAQPVRSSKRLEAVIKSEQRKKGKEAGVVAAKHAPSRRPKQNYGNVKIEAVEAHLVNLPAKGTFILAGGTYAAEGKPTPRVLVKVVGTNGVIGWGEVTPCPTWCYETSETIVTTIRNYLAPAVVGKSAWNVARIVQTMDRVIQPGATIGQPLAKSGIDTALHDMLARTLQVPLYVLLGGKRLDEISLSYIVSAHNPDDAAKQAKQGLKLGYTAFKIKVGMNNETIDRGIIEAVAGSAPKETFLWVDANQGYTLDVALRQARVMGQLGVQAFEQPLKGSRISAFRRLVSLQAVPIAIDETLGSAADLIEYVKAEAVDLPIAKIQRCGGHYHSTRFCQVAEAAGLRLMGSGLCETDLGLAHGIHLFAAIGIDLPCDLNGRQFVESAYLSKTVTVKNGRVALPNRPGTGVEVDEEKLKKFIAEI